MTLHIHNWDKWQTYRKDRHQPPWIKLHRELLRKPEWVGLSDGQRGQLVSIWMLAADRRGEIPDDARLVRKLCQLDEDPDLNHFIELGFLDANVTPERRQPDAAVTPQSREEESRVEKRRKDSARSARLAASKDVGEEFAEVFWPAYPHKVGKPAALKAFSSARKRASFEEIMGGLRRYIATKPPDRQWMNPATFLNQDRWLDQEAPVARRETLTQTALRMVHEHEEMDGNVININAVIDSIGRKEVHHDTGGGLPALSASGRSRGLPADAD